MKPELETLKTLCPNVEPARIEAHLTRLDDSYFDVFSVEQTASHIRILAGLSENTPVEILVEDSAPGRLQCTVLSFDYPGVFSLLTGIIAGLGLNIQSGEVFTYERVHQKPLTQRELARRRRGLLKRDTQSRRAIIDHFELIYDHESNAAVGPELKSRIKDIITALEHSGADGAGDVRQRVNQMVADGLSIDDSEAAIVLYPIDVMLDNSGSATRLTLTSQDTPAFLYSLSTVLSSKGYSIEKVRIQTSEGKIEDELHILDRHGERLESEAELNQLRFSVLLTKQFTYHLWHAPDPYSALNRFEQMLDDILQQPERGEWIELLKNPDALADLARVLGASDYVWEDFVRLQYESLIPILKPYVGNRSLAMNPDELTAALGEAIAGAGTIEEKRDALNRLKDREVFHIDLDQILYPARDPRAQAEPLTALAELVVSTAVSMEAQELSGRHGTPRTVGGLEGHLGVFGLGKLGGVALGYASDIELLFVYSDNGQTDGPEPLENSEYYDRLVQNVVKSIRAKREGIFHLDLRLRPHGNKGPLACSLENFIRYYGADGSPHSFERLALVRMRAISGDTEFSARVERLRDELVYSPVSISIKELRELRHKQFKEKTKPGLYNAKFSPGALVDLEYDVQIMQVTHGIENDALRTPRIHLALAQLADCGVLRRGEAERLTEAYYFLRRLINGLRMLRGSAQDLFLPKEDSPEYAHLARRMGYEGTSELAPSEQLKLDFETRTAVVRTFVEEHFGPEALPGPQQSGIADLILSEKAPDAAEPGILNAIGIRDTQRAIANLRSLAGTDARQDLFLRLALLASDVLRRCPDPDMALNNWERYVSPQENPVADFQILLSQPKRLEILISILSGSQFLADTLIRYPQFFEWITDPEILHASRTRDIMRDELARFGRRTREEAAWRDEIRKYRRREILRIGTRDICLHVPISTITRDLSELADAIIAESLQRAAGKSDTAHDGFCLLAFGKLGGRELNYSSDIDLLGVCADNASTEECEALLDRVRQDLTTHTSESHAYRVDLRLRPYGRSGVLVPTLRSLVDYYTEKASLWEIQALLKLRPVAGDFQLGQAFLDEAQKFVKRPHMLTDIAASIHDLRKKAMRQEATRATAARNVKSGLGGIRDIEFLVQGLQLAHAHTHAGILSGHTLDTLERLSDCGILSVDQSIELADDYTFLRRVEHYLQLLQDRQVHELPRDKEQLEALAKRVSGHWTDTDEFIEELDLRQDRVHASYRRILGVDELEDS